VLPFAVHGGDEEFGNGFTEELIAQLGSCGAGDVGVIARITALTFTGVAQRARQVGESLDVRYLIEGGIRRYNTRARIAVWLVEHMKKFRCGARSTNATSRIPSSRRSTWRRTSPGPSFSESRG